MPSPQAILFDIDSTLLKSGGASERSWQTAFAELYGIEAHVGDITKEGMTDPVIARAVCDSLLDHHATDEEVEKVVERYVSHLPAEVEASPGYRVLDGVQELLPRLVEDKFTVGVTTGLIEAAGRAKMERGNLNRFFPFGGFSSDSPDRGELTRIAIGRAREFSGVDIDSRQVLVLGDTPLDVKAAHDADAVSVGVATGKYSAADLRAAGADYVLNSLIEELPLELP